MTNSYNDERHGHPSPNEAVADENNEQLRPGHAPIDPTQA